MPFPKKQNNFFSKSEEIQTYPKTNSNPRVTISKIESFIEKNDIEDRVFKKDKAVFLQSIDTYKVNDNIVSAKIITKIKDLKKDEYNTEITTFNCNLIESKELLLDELFQSEYKEKIADIYSEKYFLTQNAIVFLKRRR